MPKSSFSRIKEESGYRTDEPASMLPLGCSQSRLDVRAGGDEPRVFLDLVSKEMYEKGEDEKGALD